MLISCITEHTQVTPGLPMLQNDTITYVHVQVKVYLYKNKDGGGQVLAMLKGCTTRFEVILGRGTQY